LHHPSGEWDFEDLTMAFGSPIGVTEAEQAPVSSSEPAEPLTPVVTVECGCIVRLLKSLSAMEETKSSSSLSDAISHASTAQVAIVDILECRVSGHKIKSLVLLCVLELLQLNSLYRRICDLRGSGGAEATLSVKVCGLDVSIVEVEIRKRIVDVVITTQIRDAVALSEKVRQCVRALPANDASALEMLVAGAEQDLRATLLLVS
jgi:hypothetical protein